MIKNIKIISIVCLMILGLSFSDLSLAIQPDNTQPAVSTSDQPKSSSNETKDLNSLRLSKMPIKGLEKPNMGNYINKVIKALFLAIGVFLAFVSIFIIRKRKQTSAQPSDKKNEDIQYDEPTDSIKSVKEAAYNFFNINK